MKVFYVRDEIVFHMLHEIVTVNEEILLNILDTYNIFFTYTLYKASTEIGFIK